MAGRWQAGRQQRRLIHERLNLPKAESRHEHEHEHEHEHMSNHNSSPRDVYGYHHGYYNQQWYYPPHGYPPRGHHDYAPAPRYSYPYSYHQYPPHPSPPPPPPPALPSTRHRQQQPQPSLLCEPCGKSFAMESQFQAHIKTHIPCSNDECTFSASKAVVKAHWIKEHGVYKGEGFKEIEVDGQKFKVLVGDSKEDIEKWRQERRNKWPTEVNVLQKKTDMQNRIEAGDLIAKENEPKQNDTSQPKPRKKAHCKKYIKDQCDLGDACQWNHDLSTMRCKYYYRSGKCNRGDMCKLSHTETKRKATQEPDGCHAIQKKSGFLQTLLQSEIHQEKKEILQAFRFLVSHSFLKSSASSVV